MQLCDTKSEGMVMGMIINILISLIAWKCSSLSFETVYFYISLAIGLCGIILNLQKKCLKYVKHITCRKRDQNTHDKNTKPDKTNSIWLWLPLICNCWLHSCYPSFKRVWDANLHTFFKDCILYFYIFQQIFLDKIRGKITIILFTHFI